VVVIAVQIIEDARRGELLERHLRHDLADLLERARAAGEGDECVAELDHLRLALGHVARDDERRDLVIFVALVDEKLRFHAGHFAARAQHAFGERTHQAVFRTAVDKGAAALADEVAKRAHGRFERWIVAAARAEIYGDIHRKKFLSVQNRCRYSITV